ncbi:MAG: signal peptidase II [Spirochaetaceae bacterium]|nr:signal peptidase II [Myxococcales bacterium]MCB9724020.1 signal peptidase II [Spirochaetaceae bacterium]HPG27144.1 signal peptidase II [Myxococcota bacterium]
MISKHVVFLPTVLLVVLLDQLGKQHVVETLGLGERVALLPGVIAWTHVPSVGGAFGVFRDWLPAAQLAGLAVLSLATAAIALGFYVQLARGEQACAAALGAMLGGVASNGLDRLRFGMGVDFLHPGPVGSDVLPDFNFADIAIVLGLVTLIAELLATELATRAAERPRP